MVARGPNLQSVSSHARPGDEIKSIFRAAGISAVDFSEVERSLRRSIMGSFAEQEGVCSMSHDRCMRMEEKDGRAFVVALKRAGIDHTYFKERTGWAVHVHERHDEASRLYAETTGFKRLPRCVKCRTTASVLEFKPGVYACQYHVIELAKKEGMLDGGQDPGRGDQLVGRREG